MTAGGSPDASLWELYRGEVETHVATLNDGLLALEQQPDDAARLPALMRAAHAIKGAARIVRHDPVVDLANAIEERVVGAQQGRALSHDDVQRLLGAVDAIVTASPADEALRFERADQIREDAAAALQALLGGADAQDDEDAALGAGSRGARDATSGDAVPVEAPFAPPPAPPDDGAAPRVVENRDDGASNLATAGGRDQDASVRVTAQTLTRLLGLAGEAVVATRWLGRHRERVTALRRALKESMRLLDSIHDALGASSAEGPLHEGVSEMRRRTEGMRAELTDVLGSLEGFTLRHEMLSERLHQEVQAARMRPFGELVEAFPRMVRDLARDLGKRVEVQIEGHATAIDREIADLLETPLIQAIRNAVDHGIEPPGERRASGKPESGTIRLSAKHRSGMLRIEVADDGRGVDTEAIRSAVVSRGLAPAVLAQRMDEHELLQFLFVPAFTTAAQVSDVSGRGVGLDVAAEAVRSAGGRLRVSNSPGLGFTLRFELPLTLSVLRALVVEIAAEPYAFALTRLARVESFAPDAVITASDGRREVEIAWEQPSDTESAHAPPPRRRIALVDAHDVLELPPPAARDGFLHAVLLDDGRETFGVVVDRIVGERAILVRPLDERLGKVKHVAAAGITIDGLPVLVLDVDDFEPSIRQARERGHARPGEADGHREVRAARVLVVDDSATVRAVERQVLERAGYVVDTAGDGMEAWHAVRGAGYDLVVSDVDMPRMDGLTLVRQIRRDRRVHGLPVLVLSYKDTAEDQRRARDAGANAFMGKGSFDDGRFLDLVAELAGSPSPGSRGSAPPDAASEYDPLRP